jgi:hypothetical protein
LPSGVWMGSVMLSGWAGQGERQPSSCICGRYVQSIGRLRSEQAKHAAADEVALGLKVLWTAAWAATRR